MAENEGKRRRTKDSSVTTSFSLNDVPLNVFKRFTQDIKKHCNDQYWTRLKELLDKEEAYEVLARAVMLGSMMPSEPPLSEEVEGPEDEEGTEGKDFVQTFGGKLPIRKKKEEC